MDYHVSRAGQVLGKYSEESTLQYYREGRVAPTDFVWREGMTDWLPASQVLGPPATPAAAMPPVPPPVPVAPAATFSGAALSPASAVPMPPNLHWALVLLLGLITFGIFFFVWFVVQANWVRKLDPASNAWKYMVAYVVCVFLGQFIAEAAGQGSPAAGLGGLLVIAGVVLCYVGVYSMRRSMVAYYNSTENIGLRLSGLMTFFFNMLYFQHHMSRIAAWKKTGTYVRQS